MGQDNLPRGSLAATPDLGWTQVRETVLMLELAAGQVEAAMKESSTSVDVLTSTFTSLAETLEVIEAAVSTLPDSIGNGVVKADIYGNARLVSGKVREAIVAFQFYDKLSQRLDHVCHCLGGLSDLVADKQRLYSPEQWLELQARIRSKYTMIEEREMFDAVLAGMPVNDALDRFMAQREEATSVSGDIELF